MPKDVKSNKHHNAVWIHDMRFSIREFDLDQLHLLRSTLNLLCKDWIFQLEDTCGNLHYQGYISTKERIRSKQLGVELNEKFRGIRFCECSCEGRAALKRYVMKDDSRVKGPWGKRPVYLGRDLECMSTPLPWQQEVLDIIEKPPDDRTIYWIVNFAGCAGKSKLCKYLRVKEKACRIPPGTATQIKTSVVQKGAHRCYFFDDPRVSGTFEKDGDLFSAIEDVKNGYVESAMYGKNLELLMEPPHVICFSNKFPKMCHASRDRWKILKLESKDSSLIKFVSNVSKNTTYDFSGYSSASA